MKITKIARQQRRELRFSIFVDEKYAFSLSESRLLEEKLKEGQSLDQEEFDNYKSVSDEDKIYANVLAKLARRRHSRREIDDYLWRKKVSDETKQQIFERLDKYGYLDDSEFARVWVDERRRMKSSSDRQLRAELIKKGINNELIQSAIGDSELSEDAALVDLIQRKQQQSRYKDPNKLMQYLARRGFSYGQIKTAMEKQSESPDSH